MGQGNALPAVLVAGHLCDDLGGDIAGCGETVGLLDHGAADDRAVLEHILQIDQIAVMHMLGIIIRIMKMDDPLAVRLHDVFRKKHPARQVLAHLAGHVISLHAVDRRILIGILLLHIFIVALDQGKDPVVRCICLSHKRTFIAVAHIPSCQIEGAGGHNLVLHHILDLLHGHRPVKPAALKLHKLRDVVDLCICQASALRLNIRLRHRADDLINVKCLF